MSNKLAWSRKPVEFRDNYLFTEAIEINAVWHCNIRCQWCSHASPDIPEHYADPISVGASLSSLAKFIKTEHIRILGGEPLLHPKLIDLIRAIHAAGISSKVRVLTNGLLLHKASDEFWQLVDEVHISAYPGTVKAVERYLPALQMSAEKHNVRFVLKYFDHFRVSYRLEDGDYNLTERIYRTCQIANLWRCLTLHDGRLYRCPQAAYVHNFSPRKQNGRNLDFLEVDTITSAHEVEQWLYHDTAIMSCKVCAGSVGRLVAHQLVRSQEASSMPFDQAGIDYSYLTQLESDITANNSCVVREIVEYDG